MGNEQKGIKETKINNFKRCDKMSIQELINKDKTFSESGFIAKVDNTFIMLLTAIMTDNLRRVEHKISGDLFNRYSSLLKELNNNNERQMYDELNVKSTSIESIDINEGKYVITVLLTSRYMDYKIDKTTGKCVSGINDRRIQKDNRLTFKKSINAKEEGLARKCPGCGANVDANNSGKCLYCGTIYNTESYDWILTNIE